MGRLLVGALAIILGASPFAYAVDSIGYVLPDLEQVSEFAEDDAGPWHGVTTPLDVHAPQWFRTGEHGRMRLFLGDAIVKASVTLGSRSKLVIQAEGAPAHGTLVLPRLRSGESKHDVEVQAVDGVVEHTCGTTPNAIAICRGTSFILTYDVERALSEVVVLSGVVEVRSAADASRSGTLVRAGEAVSVRGRAHPSRPRPVDADELARRKSQFQLVGGGMQETLADVAAPNGGKAPQDPTGVTPGNRIPGFPARPPKIDDETSTPTTPYNPPPTNAPPVSPPTSPPATPAPASQPPVNTQPTSPQPTSNPPPQPVPY